jgi:MFS family permease
MDQKRYPPAWLAWLVWGLGAAFYFIGFYHRVAPAVMTNQLMADFNIGAAALGNFSAFYFYSYVLMQIPTGILADYWGPRKLLTAGTIVTAVGTLLFASASSIVPANLGRLLIGGSVGVAWVATLRLSTCWFESRFYATLSGLALLCGVLGAVTAGIPLHFLVTRFGWRPVMFVAAALLFLVGILIWLIVRDDPSEWGYRGFAPPETRAAISAAILRRDLMTAFRYRNVWLLFLVGCGLTGPVITFTGLWGVPYFTTHYGMPITTASAITSTMLICFAAGATLLGMLSDRIGRRKPVVFVATITALLGWIPVLLIPDLPFGLLLGLVIIVGLSTGAAIVCFAFVKESVPTRFAGTVSGAQNMGAMGGAMILPPAIGWVLDLCWQGTIAGGVRIYDLTAYRSGFLLIIAFSILAVLAIGFTAETRCRPAGTLGGEGRVC